MLWVKGYKAPSLTRMVPPPIARSILSKSGVVMVSRLTEEPGSRTCSIPEAISPRAIITIPSSGIGISWVAPCIISFTLFFCTVTYRMSSKAACGAVSPHSPV